MITRTAPGGSRLRAAVVHANRAVAAAPLREFGVPHIVVDDVLPQELAAQVNELWPAYEEGFGPEVRGNHLLQMYRKDYARMAEARLPFWRAFNEAFWPHLAAAVAAKFEAPCREAFGKLYYKRLSLDHPLTLMQADPNFVGHSLHHHFYHAPHWAFTILLYIDPLDRVSQGTAIHRLLPRTGPDDSLTSYRRDDADWRAEVAIDTFHWEDPKKQDRAYQAQVSDYKYNRMLVFMDGPLAFHSVPFDFPDHTTPNPERARDGGRHARRRILRSHVKVHHDPFYREHSADLPEPLDPVIYMKLLAPNAVLSEEDRRYHDTVIRPFFAERVKAYARAADAARERAQGGWASSLWRHLAEKMRPAASRFERQFTTHIP
jgi:hypothetical protein